MPGSKVERARLDQPFVSGSIEAAGDRVPLVPTTLTWRDRLGGWAVRWNWRRFDYKVDPGLYAIGTPDTRSPVLVTANYRLTFDALRSKLAGRSAWLLVLDTRGINVWCAAGKGTFGTDELVDRIARTDLAAVVSHGTVVVPQLGAPGVAAHEVKRRSGFRAVYGPVRAADLPAFLDAGMRAKPEMRRVLFPARDRLVLVPVEFVGALALGLVIAAGVLLAGGIGPGVWSSTLALGRGPLAISAPLAAVLAGTVIAPLLLPALPFRMFSAKGALAGALVSIPMVAVFYPLGQRAGLLAAVVFAIAGASFAAMNFTGASTFTSLSGVEVEMRRSLPWQVAAAGLAAVLWIAGGWLG